MSLDVTLTIPSEDHREVFTANVTHNLIEMARSAGLYQPMWRPEEMDAHFARDLVAPLSAGLEMLRSSPEAMKVHNPKNGWGDYELLVRVTAGYLSACREHPDASVSVSR